MCTVCVWRELIKLLGDSSEWATCRLDFFSGDKHRREEKGELRTECREDRKGKDG